MKKTTETFVKLKATDTKGEKPVVRSFDINQANQLLKLSNSKWELSDKGYKMNGIEIAKI